MLKTTPLMLVCCLGCGPSTPPNSNHDNEPNTDSLHVATKPELQGDFTIYEQDLSMYNDPYFMRITPTADTIHNTYVSFILLTQKTDTIFNKQITIDSLGQAIIKHKIFADSLEHDKIATDYELRKIVYHGVRTNDLYFVADAASKHGSADLKILFQLSYLHKGEIGKLFVNGFSERGYGPNAGELEHERNRAILAQ